MPFSFPASPTVGDQSTQNGRTYSWSGYAWEIVATPAALPASVITSGTLDIARIPTGTSSSHVCIGNDARLSDTRTPTDGSVTTAKIANDAVTYAKIQNVSATDRLLGRSSAGAGDVEEITCTAFGRSLIDDADAAAARTTLSVQPTANPTFTGTAIVSGTFQVKANSGSLSHAFGYNENGGEISLYTTSEVQASLIDHVGGTGTRVLELVNGNDLYLGLGSGNTTGNVKIQRAGYVTAVTVSSTGTATFAGQVLVTAGSVSTCSVAPTGDPNTGLVFPSADVVTLVTNGSERVRVDASGNVGIGDTSPARSLHVARNSNSAFTAIVIDNRGTNTTDTSTYNTGAIAFGSYRDISARHYSAAIWQERVSSSGGASSSGNLILGTGTSVSNDTLPAERMRIASDGKVTFANVYDTTVGGTNRDLFIDSTGLIGYVSSIRESKTDIVTLDDVSWLSALSPVSYRYRKRNADGTYSDEADGVTDYGLIAEDVEAVRPELCFYDMVDCEPQLRGVTYSKLITPMLRYIQQLEQRIAALEERLNHA